MGDFPVKYIGKIKVIDYSDIYAELDEKLNVRKKALNSTPADKSSKEVDSISDHNPKSSSVRILTSEMVLAEGIYKYKEQKYKQAISSFDILLNKYPDDLNGLFYSGLCYYELKDYKKAIEYFNEVRNHNSRVFSEEALWYKALSFDADGYRDEALEIYTQIANNKGFYAREAAKKMR
jgi:tetratricopeptide (TPR) repeat protein